MKNKLFQSFPAAKKRTVFLSLLFLLLFCGNKICSANIDSLLNVLKTAKDTVRMQTLVAIVGHYGQDGDDKALEYLKEISAYAEKENSDKYRAKIPNLKGAYFYGKNDMKSCLAEYQKALVLYEKLNDQKELARIHNNMGLAGNQSGETEKALVHYAIALEIRKTLNDSQGISRTLNNMGMAYMEKADYKKSIECLQKSIAMDEAMHNGRGVGTSYTNLGNTYSMIDQTNEALSCYQKALSSFLLINDKKRIGNSYNNIGTIYQKIKRYDDAEFYHKKALELRTEIKDERGLASTYTNLGIVENYKNNFTAALPFLEKALEIKEKFGDKYSIISTLTSLSETEMKLLRIPKAEKHILRAIKMAQEINAPGQLKDALIRVSEIEEAKGDHKLALDYLKKSIALKDSLFQSESYKKIAEMEAKFHNEEKQKEIELFKAENAVEEIAKKKTNTILLVISIAGIISLVLVIIAIIGNIQKKKANKDLARKNKEVNEKNEEITVQKLIIEEKNKDILDSIQYAKRIQEGILPDVEIFNAFLPDSFILFIPKDIVSGDFYWCEASRKERKAGEQPEFLFAACDCTGHGVPGAFVTFLGYSALNRCVNEFGLTQPSQILDQMNLLVEETFSKSNITVNDGMDISMCNLKISADGETARLQYAGANNPLYILKNKESVVNVFQPDKQPVGRHINKTPFKNNEIDLQKGDLIFLFSDGFADQFGGEKGKKLKYSRLREVLIENKNLPMEKIGENLKKVFLDWKGGLEQVDDICVIGVRI